MSGQEISSKTEKEKNNCKSFAKELHPEEIWTILTPMTKVIGSRESFIEADDEAAMEFLHIVSDIPVNPEYRKLKYFTHHRYTTRYQHCLNVAWYSYLMSRKMNLDYVSCTRAAMLHDFYLYDRPSDAPVSGRHSDVHPKMALMNARKYFEVNDTMADCIVNHMWPTGGHMPKTPEGLVITLTDKYCASLEWGSHQVMQIPRLFLQLVNG